MFKFVKTFLFFMFCSFSLYGQKLSVTILDIDDGLSQSNVNDTIKGPYGYYWFATQDGLSRYDGYTFKNYTPQTLPLLKSNFFTRLVKFDDHHLLIGTANGLYKLNVLTDEIEVVQEAIFSGLVVSDIQVTTTSVAVVAGDRVFVFDVSFNRQHRQTSKVLAKAGRSLINFDGEQYYLSAAGSIESFWQDSPLPAAMEKFNEEVNAEALTFHVHDNALWLGTSQELWKISSQGVEKVLDGIEVRFVTWSPRQQIWLAGKDGIFSGYQKSNGALSLTEITTGLAEGSSLPTKDLSSLYVDGDYIWFGLVSKGVALHAFKEKWFVNYSVESELIKLPSNDVLSILPDDTAVWIGTGRGLLHIQNGVTRTLNKSNNPSFYSNRVTKVAKDNNGRIWLGFDQGGLVYKEPDSNEFIRLPFHEFSILVKDFLVIEEMLYVATVSAGVFAVNVNSGNFHHFHKNNTKNLSTNRIQSLQKGPSNSVLIGSFGKGIFQLDRLSKSVKPLSSVYEGLPTALDTAIIADMKVFDDDLWITTTIGAFRYNLLTQQVFHLDSTNGLPNNLVYTVMRVNKQLWFPTNKGITYYEPDTGFITSYTKQEGLINNEYNANAFATDKDGSLWVGGIAGLTVISPKLRPTVEAYLVPKLTEVKLFNRILEREQKNQIWQKQLGSTHLFLPAEARMFSLYFSTFQADLSAAVKFRYKLEGFEEQWVVNEAGVNFVTYTNLDYGTYNLLVSASLDKQNWSEPYRVALTIFPPIWLTYKAKLIYLLLFLSLLFLLTYLVWSKLKAEKDAFLKTKLNEQKLQFSMHTSGSILWELDLVNHEFRIVDYQGDDKESKVVPLTKEGLAEVLHSQDAETVIGMLKGDLSKTVFMERQYLRFNNEDGFTWMKGNSVISQRSEDGVAELVTGVSYNVNELKRTQLALKELNHELESRVTDRTEKLNVSNAQLQKTLDNLRLAQEELIESQKMASLGAMVTGIAHEINTPLGVCVTGLSHLTNMVNDIETKLQSKSLTQADLVGFLATCTDSLLLLNKNVERSAELVKSFKQVSVDETAEELAQFSLYQLIEDTMATLQTELSKKDIAVELAFNRDLTLVSFPSSLSQVIKNLTLNAVTHGFSGQKSGRIKVSVVDISQEGNEILLIFSDNGSGITEESLSKVFDPFYTSKRSAGNTGLGLHITYNLVVQKLKGAITVNSLSNTGTEFYIRLPINLQVEK